MTPSCRIMSRSSRTARCSMPLPSPRAHEMHLGLLKGTTGRRDALKGTEMGSAPAGARAPAWCADREPATASVPYVPRCHDLSNGLTISDEQSGELRLRKKPLSL